MTATVTEKNPRRWQIQIFTATWLTYVGYYFCRKAFYVVKASMADTLGLDIVDLANIDQHQVHIPYPE